MSTPSKFTTDLAAKLDAPAPTFLLSSAWRIIDEALAPVRECLEGLRKRDLSTGPCWCQSSTLPNSFLEDPAKWKHSAACLAAQQLMERLKQS